jgi:hypothetical protein
MGFSGNHTNTRVQIAFGSTAGNIGVTSHRYTYANGAEKPEVVALTLRKSDFAQWGTSGVDWANVSFIDIRFISAASTNADTKRSMIMYRVGIGGYTKPKVLISCDDIATQLMATLPLCQQRNIKGTHFVTDSEIINGGKYRTGKMSKAELDQWVAAGWDFAPHNIGHKAFALAVGAYSKSGTVVTMEVAWGTSTNIKEEITLAVGDKITVSRCNRDGVNGTWTVASVAAIGTNVPS